MSAYTLDLSDFAIRSTWPRCENCDQQSPDEDYFELKTYFTFFNLTWVTVRVCKECCKSVDVYITQSEHSERMRYGATIYIHNEMIIGFGRTEDQAIDDMRARYSEMFNRDIVNFKRN